MAKIYDICLGKPNEIDLYLQEQPVSYDIHLNPDVKEADILIYSLMFHDSITLIPSALQIGASVKRLETRHSLGLLENTTQVGVSANESVNKIETAHAALGISASVKDLLSDELYFEGIVLEPHVTAEFTLYRYRAFEDMDSSTLSAYDEMTLNDVDYIVV